MTLHDELERIATRAPVADVPDDTWPRARRARRRDLGLTVAGVAAVLALVAGAVAWLPDHLDPPVAATGSLGVPDQLYGVPERMSDRENDGSWMRDEVTDDPTVVGVGAAAWVTDQGLPVVVDAERGDYHLLDLRDFAGNNETFARGLGVPVVALSPDGTELAYGYAVFGPHAADAPIPSGVRVVDLTTGALREILVPGEEGTAIDRIEWSEDGRWLAFTGRPQDTWTAGTMGSRGPGVIGRVPPGSDTATVRSLAAADPGITINDLGSVGLDVGTFKVWSGKQVMEPDALLDAPLSQRLGTTADGLEVRLPDDAVVVRPAVGAERPVIDVPAEIAPSLSLATALMTADRPTVERPAPDWPWSDEHRAAVVGLYAGLGVVFLIALRRTRRRHRQRVAR
ncbi:hypothetical protein GCM10009795_050960 [Nocardioides hankookensis]|uniref:WD40 repeat domain-containing protein n=1 Tax=Nocardioides hankookensis TaxID=443157 RepID=A0ABW1LFN4_9ACTN